MLKPAQALPQWRYDVQAPSLDPSRTTQFSFYNYGYKNRESTGFMIAANGMFFDGADHQPEGHDESHDIEFIHSDRSDLDKATIVGNFEKRGWQRAQRRKFEKI